MSSPIQREPSGSRGTPSAAQIRSQGTTRVKKKVSGRRSVKVEIEVLDGTQTAASKRAAEGEVRALIGTYALTRPRLIGAIRRWLKKRLPTAHEVVYEYRDCFVISYSPNEHGYEGLLGIRASRDGVRLYFNFAKELPDPEKLLQGSGKQTRWMNLESASVLARPEVASLIDEAIARNQIPFADTGTGSVVIRSTSAQQQRRLN